MKGTAAGLYRATMLLSIFVPSPASAPSAILDPALRVAGAPIAERKQPAKPRIGGPIGRIDEVRLKATNLWRGHPDDLAKPNSLRLEVEIKRNATSDWRASELIDIVNKAEKPEVRQLAPFLEALISRNEHLTSVSDGTRLSLKRSTSFGETGIIALVEPTRPQRSQIALTFLPPGFLPEWG